MKIFEVAGVGKLHGLTVMSLDAFVKDDEKEVEEAVEGRQKHKVAVTVSDPNHPMVSKRGETRQRMCSVTADGREQACDTAVNWYKKQGYRVHDHNYVGTVEDTVKEGVMSDLHLQFADVYDELAPGIEKHKDSVKAGQLYDALKLVAEKNGAVSEFKRMMMSARNSAHQDYDTNPGGFENWFWYLPFGDELGESINPGVAEGWQEDTQDLEDWTKEVSKKLYRAHENQRHALARQLSKVEQKHFGSELTNGPLTNIVFSTLQALSKGQMVHYDPQSVGQMPFGSMVGDDARIIAAAGVSSDELVGYRMLSDKGIVDNIKQFLQLRRVVWNKNWPTEYLEKFEGNPGALWLQFVEDLGWSKDDVREAVQAKTDDKLLAYYAQRKAEKQKQQQGVSEGGMPSSVIKSKQRYGDMSDKDFAELHQSKADDDLVAMAWRHGYGKGSLHYVNKRKRGKEGVAEGGEKYKVKSIGHDAKGDYYISPSTGKKVYKSGVKRGDHENPNTGEIKKNIAEAPGDFGLGANYRAVPDAEMQDLMGRSKNKTKTKRDKFDYPYIHGSNIQVKDEAGKTFDAEALKKSIMVRPGRILGQNAKMQHSETGTEAIFDIGLPALKGLAVNEKTGEFVVVDTCPGAGACKTFCYAMKGSYVMFKAVSMGLARMLNFLLNDPTGFASQLNAEIAAAKSKMAKKNAKVVVRWHDAGDFFSAEYLDMAYGVANANQDVGFYAYTKMADVATGQRPKNFNMNFSGGAVSSQEKKIDFQRVKHSKVVPKDMFFDLIARDGTSLKKDAKGRMQFASPENLDQFKSIMAQKYAIDKNSILTYDEMMKTPVGDKPKWNTIVMPGDGDNSANRNDVVGSYLLFH